MPVTHPRSPSRSASPAAKRPKLSAEVTTSAVVPNTDLPEALSSMTEEEEVEHIMSLPFEYEKKYEKEVNYGEKLVLAPMVRTGSCECLFMHAIIEC
jgi:hypothetical protein